ncbi:succinylglutamate desuccinylase/aspartoacylase family protein [Temperatibacter marinus]|uniref:Succinylglutamate desuccinylase/aspartoacylase family protein n=1 Tax=Temperatibacter marinus TaxID=1456591 RepID=A0AA52HAA3_9PROT|nr:succinylglutamate desuccinylase/aspartoacylase family protein [Temperatibacter marinus]WND03412.1 succinylglutamate desuccinylase/aspartoacylase family protein [Temperatibacter marinus]
MKFVLTVLLSIAFSMSSHAGVKERKIITKLKVDDLGAGRHEFYFKAGYRNTGDALLIPVIVFKGTKEGPRLMLTAAVHGDELNGIGVLHRLAAELNPKSLKGTVIMVPGINRTGLENNSRYFHESNGGGSHTDLNRVMPGEKYGHAGERFAYHVWHYLLKNNADKAIDLHTQTRGTAYPLYVFSDFRNAAAKKMAYLLGPDLIKEDKGQKGTVETTFVTHDIPAVTLEIGAPKIFQKDLINRAIIGIKRVMKKDGMIKGETLPVARVKPYVGTKSTTVYTHTGGILMMKVALLDHVKEGQVLGCINDPFGHKLKCYRAPHKGVVLAVSTDPMREPGSMVARLLK